MTTPHPEAALSAQKIDHGLGVSLDAIRRLFSDLADRWDVGGEAKELFRAAAYALGDYRDEAEAIMADAPGRWVAWEETEADSDPSDIDCGYSTCWMVGWSHLGARDEDHTIRTDSEAEARLLAANLNRLLTSRSPTPTDAQPKAARPVGDEALRGAARKALNYIENNESELGISLDCGDNLRAALASHPTTGQETVATSRDGGVREIIAEAVFVHLHDDEFHRCEEDEQFSEAREDWRERPDLLPRLRERAYLVADATIAALPIPGSAGPGETYSDLTWDNPVVLPAATDRGLAGQIMDAAWPEFGGNNLPAEFWSAFDLAIRFTLAATPSPAQEPGTGDTGEVDALAREIAADKIGSADPTGARLPYDIWRQALPEARRRLGIPTSATPAETRGPAEGAR